MSLSFQKIAQGLGDFFGQFIRRYSPAIITLLFIAGAFFFYINVILEKNEQTIKERSFRGLNRIAGNIKKKIEDYSVNNSRYFLRQINSNKSPQAIRENQVLVTRDEYGLVEDSTGRPGRDTFSIRYDKEWQIVFNISKDQKLGRDKWVYNKAAAPVAEFISPLLRRDLFSYYFIAYKDSVLYDELSLANSKYKAPEEGVAVNDSTINGKVVHFNFINEVEVGGKRYKLFITPFTAAGNSRFMIGGYISLEKYEDEKKYIPGNAILWLILALMVVVLMFPLLKIFLMNKTEQLMARNVLTSLMSVHLLGAIIILILINVYAYFILIRGKTDEDLRSLATNIQSTFNDELKDAIAEIDNSESELVNIVKTHPKSFTESYLPDMFLPSRDSLIYKIAGDTSKRGDNGIIIRPERLGSKYRYFENISWTDSNGQHLVRWTNNRMLQYKANIRKRDYFQAVLNKSLLLTDSGKQYYLTGVSSWTAQKKLVVISRPSRLKEMLDTSKLKNAAVDSLKKSKVVSLSSPFRSLFNPILPYGFGFCIIDERGNVFFHYDEKRSLNENLLEECNNARELSSILNTGQSGIFDAHYTGSNQRFYVRPMNGIPYYIVTYYDIENIWNQDLDVMSATAVIVLFNLAFILVLVLITRMFSFKRLSNQILFIWLEPKFNRRNAYIKVTWGFAAAAIIELLFAIISSASDDLYMVGIPFGFTHIVVTYSFLIYKKSDEEDPENKGRSFDFWKPFKVLCWLYVLANIVFVWQLSSGRGVYIFSQLSLILALLIIGFFTGREKKSSQEPSQKLSQKPEIPARNEDYKIKYQRSLYTFILATGIIPALIYFSLSFREEQRLTVRYQQLDFVNNFLQKKPFMYYKGDSVWDLSYRFPFHYKAFADTLERESVDTVKTEKYSTLFGKLYATLKPSFSTYAKRIEFLSPDKESEGNIVWQDTRSTDSMRLWFNVLKTNTLVTDNKRVYATKKFENGFIMLCKEFLKQPVYHILLILAAFIVFAGIYMLISFLVPEMFYFHKAISMSAQDIGNRFINDTTDVNHIYMLGIINSGKHKKVKENFQEKYYIYDLDIASIVSDDPESTTVKTFKTRWDEILADLKTFTSDNPDAGLANDDPKKGKGRLILIRHFEMQMSDIEITKKKLNILETLLSFSAARKLPSDTDQKNAGKGNPYPNNTGTTKRSIKIIISSARHFDSMPLTLKSDDGKTDKDFTDRWINVMNNFCTFYLAWKNPGNKDNSQKQQETSAITIRKYCLQKVEDMVANECSNNDYLYSLRQPLRQYLEEQISNLTSLDHEIKSKDDKKLASEREYEMFDTLCVRLQSIAHHYYLALWQSLTEDEQRTLYDIASDGLMNRRNKEQAENLFGLGLITLKANGTGYELMNESFRLFVLTRLGKKEMDKLRSDADPAHSFNRIQLPVIIVVVALGVFLFITQKDAFNNLVTYLGAAAAGIAALLKVLDSFSTPKPAGS